MTSKPVAFLLADLGVTKSHSRPHVSNDNPYSESQFKTLKYRPDFPAASPRSKTPGHTARSSSPGTTRNTAIPAGPAHAADIHFGHAQAVQAARAHVLTAAYTAHPERFVRQPPAPPRLPAASWINRPGQKEPDAQ